MDTNETTIFIAVLTGTLIIITFLIFFVISIIRYQRISFKKQREKITADIMILEEERLRLSADLHDEFGTLISTLKLTLHCFDIHNAEDELYTQKAEYLIDQLAAKVREVSANLLPLHMREKSLDKALEVLVENIRSVRILNLSYQNSLPQTSLEKKMHIYRLVQEITNNTIKHAEAKDMQIHLNGNKKKLHITIHDNGKGFEPTVVRQGSRGLGLKNIWRRVEIMSGKVWLETAPGRGTKYTIEIPNN